MQKKATMLQTTIAEIYLNKNKFLLQFQAKSNVKHLFVILNIDEFPPVFLPFSNDRSCLFYDVICFYDRNSGGNS